MDFMASLLKVGLGLGILTPKVSRHDNLEDQIQRRLEQISDEELIGFVLKDKLHYDVQKHYVNKIKQDPNSEFVADSEIQFAAAYLAMDEILGHRMFKHEMSGVASTNPKLTQMQHHVLTMFFDLGKSCPQELGSFLHQENIFLGLFFKENAQDFLLQIETIYKKTPVHFLALCNLTIPKLEKYTGFQRTISDRVDSWLARQLNVINFRKAVQEEPEFEKLAFEYLVRSSKDDANASGVIIRKCDSFSGDMQRRMWRAVYTNSSMDKKREIINNFLYAEHNHDTNLRFFTTFISFLDAQQQAQILGVISDQQQQRFARIVKPFTSLTEIKIKKPQETHPTYLVWQLLESGKISDKEILTLIQEAHLPDKKEPAANLFLFQEKSAFYPDLFVAGCQKMKDSQFLMLRWVASFAKCRETQSWLATKWSDLPSQMRQNENMILTMDNHFDLIYQTALRGDTGILNEVKNHINKEELKKRLTMPHSSEQDTAMHALCRQSKKGITKLLEIFTPEEKQALLQIKNGMDQTPMDCCSSDFYRFMTQGNFVRPEQPKKEKETPETQVVAELVVPTQKVELTWRPMVRMAQFERDLEEFSSIPAVVDAAKKEIHDLRTMTSTELHLRMRQDLKASIKNKPCVADFSIGGTAYRMGYVVKNGVLAPFFLMSHERYNNELKNRSYMPFLTKLARRMAEEFQKS